ncbi:MAG: flippase-like domain-containing protein [Anaerolineae bacterium]|nr:MAG: flippase-like domain-containing protein [Anaerolineae bacterium]
MPAPMIRRILILIVLFAGAGFISLHFSSLSAELAALGRGDFELILLALGVVALVNVNMALSYKAIFNALGIEESVWRLIPLAAAASFINIVAPSVGASSVALLASEAHRRGQPVGRATIAATFYMLYDLLGFMLVLALGIIVLIRRNTLDASEIAATFTLSTVAVTLVVLMALGLKSAERLESALLRLARIANRLAAWLRRPAFVDEKRTHSFAQDMAEALLQMRSRKRNFLLPLLFSLTHRVLFIAVLVLMFLAFTTPFSAGTIIGGFSIGYLFTVVSPTPAGIGVVETLMPLGLVSLNVPLGRATVITLAYRALTFWFPLLIGFVAFQTLHGRGLVGAPESEQV